MILLTHSPISSSSEGELETGSGGLGAGSAGLASGLALIGRCPILGRSVSSCLRLMRGCWPIAARFSSSVVSFRLCSGCCTRLRVSGRRLRLGLLPQGDRGRLLLAAPEAREPAEERFELASEIREQVWDAGGRTGSECL